MIRGIALLLVICTGCGAPSKNELLHAYLTGELGLSGKNYPKVIVVATEDGCAHCNRAFADLIRPKTELRDCLFIIRIDGATVSLNGFMEEGPNIRFDDDHAFKRLGILSGSGVILMNGQEVDTIIPIQLDGIQQRLAYTERLLDSISTSTGN